MTFSDLPKCFQEKKIVFVNLEDIYKIWIACCHTYTSIVRVLKIEDTSPFSIMKSPTTSFIKFIVAKKVTKTVQKF